MKLGSAENDVESKPGYGWNMIEPRKTDALWEKIFYVAVISTLIVSLVIIVVGEPSTLSMPTDPDGRVCGVGALEKYPFIYFVTPSKKYMYRTVCVSTCPTFTEEPSEGSSLDCAPNSVVSSCVFKISKSASRANEVLIYDTTEYMNKICLPRNSAYFNLVSHAMQINVIEQMFKSMRDSAWLILGFTLFAVLLSYCTKFLIDKRTLLKCILTSFFVISSIGFILLGVLFFMRFLYIALGNEPSIKKVIEEDIVLANTVTSYSSSEMFNLFLAIVCVVSGVMFIYKFLSFECGKTAEEKELETIRAKMLGYVSTIINEQGLMRIPFVSIALCILIFLAAFTVITNGEATGTFMQTELKEREESSQPEEYYSFNSSPPLSASSEPKRILPFEALTPPLFMQILCVVLLLIFIWMIVFIIEAALFLSYALTFQCIDKEVNNVQNGHNFLFTETKRLILLRVGTIALSALTFFIRPIRSFLESIDTYVQRKDEQTFETQNIHITENKESEGCLFSILLWFSRIYRSSFLKSIQPYGYLLTYSSELNFLTAGGKTQSIIDNTFYWFEDMLDGGQVFESQVKFTIVFITTTAFYIVMLFTSDMFFSTVTPTVLMILSCFLVAELYVNTYGSIYSTMILYTLVKFEQEFDINDDHVNNETSLLAFKEFIDNIDVTDEQEEEELEPISLN